MSRISVSLPDELTSRLEPFKEKVNVSQVCREALERRVAAFEMAAEQGDDLDAGAMIARLREEREMLEGRFQEMGGRNAASWLDTVSYIELKGVAENHGSSPIEAYKLPRSAFKIMKRDAQQAHVSCDGLSASVYKSAWLDYVRVVWSRVIDQAEQENPSKAVEVTA